MPVAKSETLMNTILETIVMKGGYEEVKANLDDFETPKALTSQRTGVVFIPDFTASKNGKKVYIEIAIKSDELDNVINKWKLLDTLAKIKGGDFVIVIPKGHFRFASDILKDHEIHAKTIRL